MSLNFRWNSLTSYNWIEAKTKKIDVCHFYLPNIKKTFLFEENLPLCESLGDRTSFPLQKPREARCPLSPMVAKVLVCDSALTSWMLQPGIGILSDMKMTQFIIQAWQRQRYPMTGARVSCGGRVQCQQCPNQTFPVPTLAVAPNSWPLLVSACFIRAVLLQLDSGICLISL